MKNQALAVFLAASLTIGTCYAEGSAPVTHVATEAPHTEVTLEQKLAPKSYQIDTTKSAIPLHSRLKGVYSGYSYTISNNSAEQVELLHAEIVNGVNGSAGALGVQKSSAAAIGGTLGGGLVLGFVTFGITFLVALVASPFIYAANHHANTKTTGEGIKFPNQISTGVLSPGDNVQFTALVPLGQTPQVKMTFKNVATNEIFTMTK